MNELAKCIFLECWYQHEVSQRCPERTKLTRKAFGKAVGKLPPDPRH